MSADSFRRYLETILQSVATKPYLIRVPAIWRNLHTQTWRVKVLAAPDGVEQVQIAIQPPMTPESVFDYKAEMSIKTVLLEQKEWVVQFDESGQTPEEIETTCLQLATMICEHTFWPEKTDTALGLQVLHKESDIKTKRAAGAMMRLICKAFGLPKYPLVVALEYHTNTISSSWGTTTPPQPPKRPERPEGVTRFRPVKPMAASEIEATMKSITNPQPKRI